MNLHRLAETLGPGLIRALGLTWRVRILPEGVDDARRRGGQRFIFAFWHGRMLIPAFTHRFKKIGILISRHGDGEFIARVVNRLGFRCVRGSTTRGGRAGLLEMMRLSRAGHDVAFTPDGPRGPRYTVQPGVVFAASRTGLPIVPVALEADPAWVLRSWDEFTIPKPGALTIMLKGDPYPVARDLDAAGLEAARVELERRLHVVMAEAREYLAETRRRRLR